MKKFILLLLLLSTDSWSQSSMRRCTLLPVTDSVGGAVGFKVFERIENELKKSNWCTYISNSGMMSVFSRYRESLPQYIKKKEVLSTVADKLKVGSLVTLTIVNDLKGVEILLEVFGEDGEDIYFSEKKVLGNDDVDLISDTAKNWLDIYARTIPYDAKINGVLGDQITLDVGKGYPIQVDQDFIVRRPMNKKKHPLFKKIVDWESETIAEGTVFDISDNQALGVVRDYKSDKKIAAGDWVRLKEFRKKTTVKKDEELKDSPGTLGIASVYLYGSSSSVDTSTPTGNKRMSGNLFGIDLKGEGWITRHYFATIEIRRSIGTLSRSAGTPEKKSINVNNGSFKLLGGYKYLPIGFFFGPQIDFYTGWANHSFDLDTSVNDGFGKNSISGLVLGVGANIPINRDYRFFTRAEFIPFPSFDDTDKIFSSNTGATAMELEVGLKYQYTPRMTLDASLETISRKARFESEIKEVSYKDNLLKLGASFNF